MRDDADNLLRLLELPGRAATCLSELRRFFKTDTRSLYRFVKLFGGQTFTVPGPEIHRDAMRDLQIVEALDKDASLAKRIVVCRQHRVDWAHVEAVYRQLGLRLPPLELNGPAASEARKIIGTNKSVAPLVCQIMELSKEETAAILSELGVKGKKG